MHVAEGRAPGIQSPSVRPLQTEQPMQAPDIWNLVDELHDLAMEGHNLSQSWYSPSEEKLKK